MKAVKLCLCMQVLFVVTCSVLVGLMIKFDKDYEHAKNTIVAGNCTVITCLRTDNDYVVYKMLFTSNTSQFIGSLSLYHSYCMQNSTIIDCWSGSSGELYASYPSLLNEKWIILPIILGLCLINILFVMYVILLAKYDKVVADETVEEVPLHTIS